ncbi:hypothetical protein GCM10018953_08220 [Streptosporangium nondiastaticum]
MKDPLDLPGLPDRWDSPDPPGPRDRLDSPDPPDLGGRPDPSGPPAYRPLSGQGRDHGEPPVLPGLKDPPGLGARPDPRDLRDHGGRSGPMLSREYRTRAARRTSPAPHPSPTAR